MDNRHTEFIQSFGRTGGRKLRGEKKEAFQEILPKVRIELPENSEINPLSLFSSGKREISVEIGFGGGEHLIHQAENNLDSGFIGSEVYKSGIATCLSKISNNNIDNIRIFSEDARLLLKALPNKSIDKIFILFPDPWPKIAHFKRRIINQETLFIISRILKNRGLLRLATDHSDYLRWIIIQLTAFNKANNHPFLWLAENACDWKNTPEDSIKTRYQKKAEEEGRSSVFLNFMKL